MGGMIPAPPRFAFCARTSSMGRMAGQTQSEIRRLLDSAGLAPLHRFGQNFLIDLNLMRKLIDAANVQPGDFVLEVGPGTGSLTELLLERGASVTAVEIDHGLQELLRRRLADQPNFKLIAGDILAGKRALNAEALEALNGATGRRLLVANLPYQVATPLLVELLLLAPPLTCLACTIQKEVAERLRAAPGTADYGPLSVIVQSLAQVEWIATLSPGVFWPAPQVESAMIRVTPLPATDLREAAEFAHFVQEAFSQRRKMLRRLLRDAHEAEGRAAFAAAEISPEARPEQVSVSQWQTLHRAWPRRSG